MTGDVEWPKVIALYNAAGDAVTMRLLISFVPESMCSLPHSETSISVLHTNKMKIVLKSICGYCVCVWRSNVPASCCRYTSWGCGSFGFIWFEVVVLCPQKSKRVSRFCWVGVSWFEWFMLRVTTHHNNDASELPKLNRFVIGTVSENFSPHRNVDHRFNYHPVDCIATKFFAERRRWRRSWKHVQFNVIANRHLDADAQVFFFIEIHSDDERNHV